jgi:CYTH domain-containing protein
MVAEFHRHPPSKNAVTKWKSQGSSGEWTYSGGLAGLVTADVELPSEEHPIIFPDWAGPEITHVDRYGTSTLAPSLFSAKHPEP